MTIVNLLWQITFWIGQFLVSIESLTFNEVATKVTKFGFIYLIKRNGDYFPCKIVKIRQHELYFLIFKIWWMILLYHNTGMLYLLDCIILESDKWTFPLAHIIRGRLSVVTRRTYYPGIPCYSTNNTNSWDITCM